MMDGTTLAALILFAVTYALIFTLEKARPYIALASAVIFVAAGMFELSENFDYGILGAISEID